MPELEHPKHEAFCQALAAGETADKAYVTAGYKPHASNPARLSGNERIKARVAELVAARSQIVQKATGYKALEVFAIIQQGIDLAIENKSHEGVIKGGELMARLLGYTESPTLTHEHLNGITIPVARGPEPAHPNSEAGQNVLRFGRQTEILKKITGK